MKPEEAGLLVKKLSAWLFVLGILCVLSVLWMYSAPHWLGILLAAVSFVALMVALILTATIGFARWRQLTRYWMAPGLICLGFLVLAWHAPAAGRMFSDRAFERHLPEYMEAVREIKDGPSSYEASGNRGLVIITLKNSPPGIRAIKGIHCQDGSVVAAFLLDAPVPMLHEGYVYKDYEEGDSCIKVEMVPENNWVYIRHVDGHWYHFSDQPGL